MIWYCIPVEACELISGVCYVRAPTILKKIEWSNCSTVVEFLFNWQGSGEAKEYLGNNKHSMSCCCVWPEVDLFDDVLVDMRLGEINFLNSSQSKFMPR